MNRIEPLLVTSLVRIERFDHPAGMTHQDPREEEFSAYSVNFVESGEFEIERGRRRWQLDPGTVFLSYPGLSYRCRHRDPFPRDVCLSVHYPSGLPEGIARRDVTVPVTHRLGYIHFRLQRWAAGSRQPLSGEALAAELWQALHEGGTTDRLYSARCLAWYCERVEAVREILETRYAEAHCLAPLGREVGMSPFHLARVFRELTGAPPHRYLLRVRLERATEFLREGLSVTETSSRSGFENLSHFIRSFRRAYGVTPSRLAPRKARKCKPPACPPA